MKKQIFIYVLILLLSNTALSVHCAESIRVTALTEFASNNPVKTMKVMAIEKYQFKNGIVFEDGTVIYGNIVDVKQPKIGKLNASFKFVPVSYTYNGKTTEIYDTDFVAKYAEDKPLNKGEIATAAATTAGSMILKIPGFSQGISMIKGMYKNTENNRLKSGVVQVYKDSPLSYVEEGKDIIIKKDTIFVLKFKSTGTDEQETGQVEYPNNVTPVSQTEVKTSETVVNQSSKTGVASTKPVDPYAVLKEVESKSK